MRLAPVPLLSALIGLGPTGNIREAAENSSFSASDRARLPGDVREVLDTLRGEIETARSGAGDQIRARSQVLKGIERVELLGIPGRHPENLYVLHVLHDAHVVIGQVAPALAMAERIASKVPSNRRARFMLATALLNRFDVVEREIARIARRHGEKGDARMDARRAAQRGLLDRAEAEYRAVVGEIMGKAGEPSGGYGPPRPPDGPGSLAAGSFRPSPPDEADWGSALFWTGKIAILQGLLGGDRSRFEAAVVALRAAAPYFVDRSSALLAEGEALGALGSPGAELALAEAVRRDPTNYFACLALAELAARNGRLNVARGGFSAALAAATRWEGWRSHLDHYFWGATTWALVPEVRSRFRRLGEGEGHRVTLAEIERRIARIDLGIAREAMAKAGSRPTPISRSGREILFRLRSARVLLALARRTDPEGPEGTEDLDRLEQDLFGLFYPGGFEVVHRGFRMGESPGHLVRFFMPKGYEERGRRLDEVERAFRLGGALPGGPVDLGGSYTARAPWGFVDLLLESGGPNRCRAFTAVREAGALPFRDIPWAIDLPGDGAADAELLSAYGPILPR